MVIYSICCEQNNLTTFTIALSRQINLLISHYTDTNFQHVLCGSVPVEACSLAFIILFLFLYSLQVINIIEWCCLHVVFSTVESGKNANPWYSIHAD